MSTQERKLEERIIKDLKEQRTFRFSSPWRPRRSAALVVPVIRTVLKARDYITIQEAKAVEIQDTGSIGVVRITNGETRPLFVRVGSLLEGKGTQSRAVNKSVMVAAGQTLEVGVNCVHHSHYIDPTAKFVVQARHLAPASVERGLVGADQETVWGAVSNYGAAKSALGGATGDGGYAPGPDDNLVGTLGITDRFTEMVDELTKEIPNHEEQVGLVVFDERGVYGIEVFDSPESWRVFNDAVVEKFAEVLVPRVDERVLDVSVKDENVVRAIVGFLEALQDGAASSESDEGWETVNVTGGVCCEATFAAGQFVHLTAVRDDEALAQAAA